MSLLAKSLFAKDYGVRTLELKGDYEIWARDIEEYFLASGLPQHFAAITSNTEPDVNDDYDEAMMIQQKRKTHQTRSSTSSSSSEAAGPSQEEKALDLKTRHTIIM